MPSMVRRHREAPRTARMELRVKPTAKAIIRRAMAASGLSAGDLAFDAAKRVLEEQERVSLSGADRASFLDLVLNPPRPTPRLKRAFRRYARSKR